MPYVCTLLYIYFAVYQLRLQFLFIHYWLYLTGLNWFVVFNSLFIYYLLYLVCTILIRKLNAKTNVCPARTLDVLTTVQVQHLIDFITLMKLLQLQYPTLWTSWKVKADLVLDIIVLKNYNLYFIPSCFEVNFITMK